MTFRKPFVRVDETMYLIRKHSVTETNTLTRRTKTSSHKDDYSCPPNIFLISSRPSPFAIDTASNWSLRGRGELPGDIMRLTFCLSDSTYPRRLFEEFGCPVTGPTGYPRDRACRTGQRRFSNGYSTTAPRLSGKKRALALSGPFPGHGCSDRQ